MDLNGKVAIVTGTVGAIGRGMHVVVGDLA